MKRNVNWLIWLRRIGNVGIPLGYIVLLNFDLLTGVLIRLAANLCVVPWAYKSKMYDFQALLGFLMCIELHKLITILFFS